MSVPFREEDTGALARAEALEIENQELREEIERLKDRVGENRDAYVKHVEDQAADLRIENQHLRKQIRERADVRLAEMRENARQGNAVSFAVVLIAFGFAVILAMFGK